MQTGDSKMGTPTGAATGYDASVGTTGDVASASGLSESGAPQSVQMIRNPIGPGATAKGGKFIKDIERGNEPYQFGKSEYGTSGPKTPAGNLSVAEQALDEADKLLRLGFIRKVYGILIVQLLFSFGITTVFMFVGSVKDFVQQSPVLFWLAFFLTLGFMAALLCCPNVARKYPRNYMCLLLFTVFEAYLIGVVSSYYDTNAVLMAVGLTIVAFLGLMGFAYQTSIDFTFRSGAMFSLMMILIFAGTLSIAVPAMRIVYAGLSAIAFSVFIVWDTQQILGGKHRQYQFSVDDYVLAALCLYIDVIQLFLFLLSCIGGGGTNNE
eukprot:gb/GECG01004866.1/.p1 GENE.gb/GECG01004866.1/~~gb/GECG01004866.1/.p1  ORF type:complete len:323 (+),score=24.25 gb/GECG01004866.1/:1-969(+)